MPRGIQGYQKYTNADDVQLAAHACELAHSVAGIQKQRATPLLLLSADSAEG
jgi:hypothetical protein